MSMAYLVVAFKYSNHIKNIAKKKWNQYKPITPLSVHVEHQSCCEASKCIHMHTQSTSKRQETWSLPPSKLAAGWFLIPTPNGCPRATAQSNWVSRLHHMELERINWWSTWAKNLKKCETISAGKCNCGLLIGVSKPWHSEVVTSRHTWHNFPRFEPSQHCFDFFWLNPNTTDLHLTKASKIFKDSSQSVLVSRTTGNRSLWYLLMIFVYGILWQIPTRCHQVDSLGVESAAHESACRSTRPITCQWKCYWCSLVQGKSRAADSLAMLSLPPVDRLSIFPCHQCGTVGRRPGWRRLGRGPSQDSPVAPAWVSTHFSSDNSGCFQ